RHLQQPTGGGKRAVFGGIGGQLVEDQRETYRELGRKEQRIAVQVEADMAIGTELGEQQVPDIAAGAVDARDQIVGRRKRSQAGVDPAPDVWLLFKDLAQHRVDDRQFVLQPVLKLGHDQLAVFLLLDQPLGDLALL